jgi:hypothetical protein
MRSLRSVLPLSLALACSGAPAAPAPAPAPAATACPGEAQAEKAFYEAQRLFQRKRYWEAAPGYVISYQFCAHPQVLCAAGQAYKRAGKCEKAAEYLGRCLAADVPAAARAPAEKLLAACKVCEVGKVALRGTDEAGDDVMEAPEDDAPFAQAPWSAARGTSRAP